MNDRSRVGTASAIYQQASSLDSQRQLLRESPETPGGKPMRKRTHEIKIQLDDQEFARLNTMVANTVFPRETFIRLMLAGYQLKAQPDVDTKALQLKFTQIGNQLNFL